MEFEKHNDARLALAAMNKRELLGRVWTVFICLTDALVFISVPIPFGSASK